MNPEKTEKDYWKSLISSSFATCFFFFSGLWLWKGGYGIQPTIILDSLYWHGFIIGMGVILTLVTALESILKIGIVRKEQREQQKQQEENKWLDVSDIVIDEREMKIIDIIKERKVIKIRTLVFWIIGFVLLIICIYLLFFGERFIT